MKFRGIIERLRSTRRQCMASAASVTSLTVCFCAMLACTAASSAAEVEDGISWDIDDRNIKAVFRLPDGDLELASVLACEILVLAASDTPYRLEVPGSEWLSAGVELVGDGPTLSSKGDGVSTPDRWMLHMMPMDAGELSIPGPTVVYEEANGGDGDTLDSAGELLLQPCTLKVVNPLDGAHDAELRPMKDPIPAQVDYRHPLAVLLAAVGVAVCAVALVWALRRRLLRKDREVEEICRRRPAHEVAYDRLRRIEEDQIIERSLHREFYFAISECLREYIENRYAVPALEMTTEEFFEYSRARSDLPEICRSGAVDLLNLSDLVKFARRESLSDEMKQVFASVRRLVDDTREVDDAQEAAETRESPVMES